MKERGQEAFAPWAPRDALARAKSLVEDGERVAILGPPGCEARSLCRALSVALGARWLEASPGDPAAWAGVFNQGGPICVGGGRWEDVEAIERSDRGEGLAICLPRAPRGGGWSQIILESLDEDEGAALYWASAERGSGRPIGPTDREAAARLSARLGGLPLGLIEAASRARALPPSSFLSRLDEGSELFALLRAPGAASSALGAEIGARIEGLYPKARLALHALACFGGPFPLGAALAACAAAGLEHADALDALDELGATHLIEPVDARGAPDAWLTAPQYVRDWFAYAGEPAAGAARAAATYAADAISAIASALERGEAKPERRAWKLWRQTACSIGASAAPQDRTALAAAVARVWLMIGGGERALDFIEDSLADLGRGTPEWGEAAMRVSRANFAFGRSARALTRAWSEAGAPGERRGDHYAFAALVELYEGDRERGLALTHEALASELGPSSRAMVMYCLVCWGEDLGADWDRLSARDDAEVARDPIDRAWVLYWRGQTERFRNDYEALSRTCDDAIHTLGALGHDYLRFHLYNIKVTALMRLGNMSGALAYADRHMALVESGRWSRSIVVAKAGRAIIMHHDGQGARAIEEIARLAHGLRREGAVRELSNVLGILASMRHFAGDLAAAHLEYEDVVSLREEAGLGAPQGGRDLLLCRALLMIEWEREQRARAVVEQMRALDRDDPGWRATLEVFAHLSGLPCAPLAEAARALRAEDRAEPCVTMGHIALRIARYDGPESLDLDALAALPSLAAWWPGRIALRYARSIEARPRAEASAARAAGGEHPSGLTIGFEAREIALGAHAHNLSRRGATRRILWALALARGGEPLGIYDLFEVGWPGVEIHPELAAKRVYWAIMRLRELGLRDYVVTEGDGYALHRALPVHVEGAP